ncbi:MAG: bacillithiol biosynthesis BshC, partial [Flavobacteriales bacterium]
MRVARFSLTKTRQLDKLILDYLSGHPALSKFVSVFPSAENFEEIIARRAFSAEKRALLKDILTSQYEQHLTSAVKQNIDALTDANTYTVTTGHQLCLFSGPMYFVFKILSTIKLAKKLSDQFPQHHFVPVFWLASEDHDVAEINHTHLFGKRINWNTTQAGAVGAMNLQGIAEALASFENILGNGKAATDVEILKEAYSLHTLSDATRHLVNALFVKYGLVILDGNDRTLKQSFSGVMKDELLHGKSAESIASTSDELKKLGYKTQVNAREINLFYLSEGNRQRIVKANGKWNV